MDEEELERLAAEELLKEAKQGAARAVVHGALGWKKDNAPRLNRRFLTTTLANTMQYNYRRSRSRSPSPRHRHRQRSKDRYSNHESFRKDKRQRSKDDNHREERERRKDKSSRKEREDNRQYSKRNDREKEKEGRQNFKSTRSRSHH